MHKEFPEHCYEFPNKYRRILNLFEKFLKVYKEEREWSKETAEKEWPRQERLFKRIGEKTAELAALADDTTDDPEDQMVDAANAIVKLGLRDLGYVNLAIDGGWRNFQRGGPPASGSPGPSGWDFKNLTKYYHRYASLRFAACRGRREHVCCPLRSRGTAAWLAATAWG